MKKKDCTFEIVSQPKHLVGSIVLVDLEEFPLKEDIHKNLCRLSEMTDIILIFSKKLNYSGIKVDKFSSIYQATGWTMQVGSLGWALTRTFKYFKSVFNGKHLIYSIWNLSELTGDITPILSRLTTPEFAQLQKAVFKIRRLGSDEVYNYYKANSVVKVYDGPRNFFQDLFLGSEAINYFVAPEEVNCRYSTWTTESRCLVLNNKYVQIILDRLDSSWMPEFLMSFDEPDLKVILVNLLKRLGMEYINSNLEDIDL